MSWRGWAFAFVAFSARSVDAGSALQICVGGQGLGRGWWAGGWASSRLRGLLPLPWDASVFVLRAGMLVGFKNIKKCFPWVFSNVINYRVYWKMHRSYWVGSGRRGSALRFRSLVGNVASLGLYVNGSIPRVTFSWFDGGRWMLLRRLQPLWLLWWASKSCPVLTKLIQDDDFYFFF